MISVRCSCGTLLQARDEHAGRATRCPKCNQVLTLPGVEESVRPAPPAPRPRREGVEEYAEGRRDPDEGYRARRRPHPAEDDEREYDRPRRRGPESSGKAMLGMILGIGTFLVPVLLAIPAVILSVLGLREVNRSGGRLTGKGMAVAGLITGVLGNVTLIPMWIVGRNLIEGGREREARVMSQNNLKQITLAFHNYNDTYRHMPPAVVFSPDGRPLYSWRVLLLPFIEQQNLYNQFRLDEPWDSPNNLPLLTQIPPVYKSPRPGKTNDPNATFYQVFTGPDTPFKASMPPQNLAPFQLANARGPANVRRAAQDGPRMPASFPDGTSNTILVAEAGEAVPWTRPDDLRFDRNGPLPRLGGLFDSGYHVGLADASIRFFERQRISDNTLRLAIMPADGMPLGPDW